MEIWKPINDFSGYYVSSLGRIKSPQNNILSGGTTKDGYRVVTLKKNKTWTTAKVSILVAKTFIPNFEKKPCVDHINTIRNDDRVENLRWVTYKENTHNPITYKKLIAELTKPARLKNLDQTGKSFTEEHKRRIGLANKGKISPYRKQVMCVETGIVYDSLMIAEEKTKIHATSIGKVCAGDRKTAGGFHWCLIKKY